MKQALFYSLKVWVTAIIFAPILIWLLDKIVLPHHNFNPNPYHVENAFYYFLFWVAFSLLGGLIFMFPLLASIYTTAFFVIKKQVPTHIAKGYLYVIGFIFSILPEIILGLWITSYLPYKSIVPITETINAISYSLVALLSIRFYKLVPSNETVIR